MKASTPFYTYLSHLLNIYQIKKKRTEITDMKASTPFYTYLSHLLNIYQIKKYLEQKLYRQIKMTSHVQHTFP